MHNNNIHQDDLQFWLLQHKESKTHLLSEMAIAKRLKEKIGMINTFLETGDSGSMTNMELMQTALKISTDAFILAEKIKI